ncbi:MAG: 2-oxoglutarate dehydrogenase complex dihydrolipoyllysine-residue succinyltransferase [Saprospiraceae bacterium]|nr:2-oxoglutarate dehydrogenase complex dihydrolipoyllysine-residue succinyltransferase [Saprospiraceae bacterium]MDW8229912.1 2-oxoglutarate dehydrogenase complex dihydrolipoyllysine-residue succinyltransferase [Saprospiraceae bacterium]
MPVIELHIPNLGESITSVTFAKWLKPDGAWVAMDEPLCEIETEKANQELSADKAGKLIHVAREGEDLEVGAVFARIDTDATQEAKAAQPAAAAPSAPIAQAPVPTASEQSHASNHPSPAAAKILAEGGLTPADVTGTGRGGRITKEDAQRALEKKMQAPAATATAPAVAPEAEKKDAPAATPSASFSREEHRQRMSRMRRTIARRLVSAKNNTAMLTTFNEVDMSAVIALREKYQEAFVKKYGIKLGFMSIFAKACAKVLLEMPDVNAFIDGDDIVYHDYADISIAISTPNGLVVPPIRNVESLGFHEIELQLKDLATKAREGRLSLEEMSGGTFTITNGGIFGSLMSTPILNEPQSAILGMHAIKERPVAVNGQVEIRPMMYLALSYDHRIVDGATSVTFLVKVKELIEDPVRLLLDL